MDKKIKRKIILLSGIAVICVVFCIYLAVSLFFMSHYFPGTMIGNLDCSGKTPGEVEKLIADKAENYKLTIRGREETEAVLEGAQIQVQFVLDNTLQGILNRQNGYAWPAALGKQTPYDMPVTVSYDEALLDERISEMLIFQRQNMRSPVNAYIGEYDRESGRFPVIAEDKGTVVDLGKAKKAIVSALGDMKEELVLEESDCYKKPEIASDNAELVRFSSRLNRFVSSRIVYDWHGMEEVVDGDLIQEWLDIDWDNRHVSIDAQAVREYINGLSKKHDTFGKEREFRTSEGRMITLKPGSYGWRVDRAKETEKLVKLIRAGSQVSREPEYLYMAAAKGENDIGDSYVEINLTAQHLYLYVEGELITESDFVSGNVSRGYTTPAGVYSLTYKTLNATLRGPGYATPVDFWMPFNGNIGMHDASWRRQFGGNIYLRNGSHGCVNLPREEAEKIYEQVYKGFPIVCYNEDTGKGNAVNHKDNTAPVTPTDNAPGTEADPNAGVVLPGVDPNTGLIIDPNTGLIIDPGTGQPVVPNTGTEGTPLPAPAPGGEGTPEAGTTPDTEAIPNAGVSPDAVPDTGAENPAVPGAGDIPPAAAGEGTVVPGVQP